jgi:2-oxoglutarate dehydrogenase E1 component
MTFWQDFHGPNSGYLFELYERYQQDPDSVDESTRAFFEGWQPVGEAQPALQAAGPGLEKAVAAANLAQAVRSYGHLAAHLDPLGVPPPGDPILQPEFHGLVADNLSQLPASVVGGPAAAGKANAAEAIQELRQVYSSRTGFDYSHIRYPEERDWLRESAESRCFRPPHDPINHGLLLEQLTKVEAFEHFLHRTFVGKTRFSIEGLDMMVPILEELLGAAAEDDICMVFLGMAHRGRLNVLAHVQSKSYARILAEFKDPGTGLSDRDEMGWMGDVKYHKGALRALESDETVDLLVCMPSNPSHLEHINPVLIGMARAADTDADRPGAPAFYPKASIPILIHGDGSFPGQGIVAETLNLSRLAGYQTAGTVHIIANNQLGYTATPEEARSTLYAADLAKGFKIPIMYVNADDPEACIEAARTAYAYRAKFQKDFVIDLIGYRRYGHNEGDEPSFTQPLLYEKIRSHKTVRQIWAEALEQQGLIEPGVGEALFQEGLQNLQKIYEELHQPEEHLDEPLPEPPPPGAARRVKTAVSLERLEELNRSLLSLPDGFTPNRKLIRGMERRTAIFDGLQKNRDGDTQKDGKSSRRKTSGEKSGEKRAPVDWAAAEELALATILEDGIPIRLTGEDAARGTFSHRHAVFVDVKTGQVHIPLQALPQAKASLEVINTPVTENATLGFEFGYNIQSPERLVIFEAQYGDFINVAQAIIDEFIVSARVKWGQTPSLVMLLPHGNEGQGPDHSSARPERFLQMAAGSLRLANPTTAAQYFHLLRRQAALLKTDPLPLVVLTPKGLLRHPLTASQPLDLAKGSWQPVLDDPNRKRSRKDVSRLILCSGRIYVDLISSDRYSQSGGTAVARVEQLAPFPEDDIGELLKAYPGLEEVFWVQEEPLNMGAWDYASSRLERLIDGRWPLQCVARQPSSSPAEGSAARYSANQRALIESAFASQKQAEKAGQEKKPNGGRS